MQTINFFDDPSEGPRAREDVRFNQVAIFVHPDGSRRIAVGFDITPFRERPSIEVTLRNANGEPAGALTVIETLETNFHLTMHLRDREPTELYQVEATLYYAAPEQQRMEVHALTGTVDLTQPGAEYTITQDDV